MEKKPKEKKKNELAVTGTPGVPSKLIELALNKGADLDKVEKVLALQERWQANEAKKVYNDAMVNVHKDMPVVAKSLKNDQTRSKYASLDDIICKTKEVYTAQGFSISFYEGETPLAEHIRICADVIHRLGHKETYHFDVPLDGKGIKGNANMTAIHAKASSTSYARRYLMCMIWNIPTGDDNDGQTASVEQIDNKEMSQVMDFIDEKGVDIKKFCDAFGINEVCELPKSKFTQAINTLKARKKT